MKIKICGLKNLKDGMVACEAGADLLGFNFYKPSPRYLDPDACRNLVQELKSLFPSVTMVGIFVNHITEVVRALMTYCQLDLAQLSGDESPEILDAIGEKAFKAFRPRNGDHIEDAERTMRQRSIPPAGLVDTYHPDTFGGGGKVGDWRLARQISARFPILLAGGLNPENVRQAVRCVSPWGVDVASGVEKQRGVKDHTKIRVFIHQARMAERDFLMRTVNNAN